MGNLNLAETSSGEDGVAATAYVVIPAKAEEEEFIPVPELEQIPVPDFQLGG